MFWIGLTALFLVLTIVLIVASGDDGSVAGGFTVFAIFLIVTICCVYSGSSDYPKLQGEYKSILLMRERVNDIRNSYYKSDAKNAVIAGSVENIKQSTTLSEAIKTLTEKETEYITYRETVLFAKDSWLYKIFMDGLFISDKVNSFPELKASSYNWDN